MENPTINKRLLVVASVLAALSVLTASCYRDNEEELYPQVPGSGNCDLTSVTYQSTIAPIMASSCNGCHSGAGASAGVVTNTYEGLKTIALNGKLYGSVSHASGYSAMPKNGNKLSACNIEKIKTWVDAGAPNN
ncbi:MAG: cytochrome c [Bacteroidales bacterium]|jgi:mono/diheme cytochrome c family protein|nr:cytochrome c [Bacteroidales bacterium]